MRITPKFGMGIPPTFYHFVNLEVGQIFESLMLDVLKILCCAAVTWHPGTNLLRLCRFGDALGQHRPMSHLAEWSGCAAKVKKTSWNCMASYG